MTDMRVKFNASGRNKLRLYKEKLVARHVLEEETRLLASVIAHEDTSLRRAGIWNDFSFPSYPQPKV